MKSTIYIYILSACIAIDVCTSTHAEQNTQKINAITVENAIPFAAKGRSPKPAPKAKSPTKIKNKPTKARPVKTRQFKPKTIPGKKKPRWTSNAKMSSPKNATYHWGKHGKDFPKLKTEKQYVAKAHSFLHTPPKGTLTKINHRNDIMRYNPQSNTFAVMSQNGIPRTMFKPKEKMKFWDSK